MQSLDFATGFDPMQKYCMSIYINTIFLHSYSLLILKYKYKYKYNNKNKTNKTDSVDRGLANSA